MKQIAINLPLPLLSLLTLIVSVLNLPHCSATLEIVTKSEWGGQVATEIIPLEKGLHHVIIHHSAGAYCNTPVKCREQMRNMQSYHMNTLHWADIGYNYAIGGDGVVYEGRGADARGAHARDWNRRSIGIVFIGNYSEHVPTAAQVQRAHELLEHLVMGGHLREDFTLFGHRQVNPTECPGNYLYNEIQKWPQWRSKPPTY